MSAPENHERHNLGSYRERQGDNLSIGKETKEEEEVEIPIGVPGVDDWTEIEEAIMKDAEKGKKLFLLR